MLGNYSQTKALEKYRYLSVGRVIKLGSLMPGTGIYSSHFLGRMGVVLTALAVSQGTLNFHTPREWASPFGKRALQP